MLHSVAFWGWVVICVGFFLVIASVAVMPMAGAGLLPIALLVILGGVLCTWWSKVKCYRFSAPISHRWAISAAFWLDVVALVLRLSAGRFNVGFSLQAAATICVCLSFICFLVFLGKLSVLVGRDDLLRTSRWVFILTWAAVSGGLLTYYLAQNNGGALAALPLLIAAPAVAIGFILYGLLIFRLSQVLRATAAFLEIADREPNAE